MIGGSDLAPHAIDGDREERQVGNHVAQGELHVIQQEYTLRIGKPGVVFRAALGTRIDMRQRLEIVPTATAIQRRGDSPVAVDVVG